MPVLSLVVNPVEFLCELWEQTGIFLNSQNHNLIPIITVHYQDKRIRIIGLPDEPKFLHEDIQRLIPHTPNKLISGLEIFSTKEGKALNLAGVYRVIFSAIENCDDKKYLRSIEQYFVTEIEPALRKYGFPSQTTSEEAPRN